LAHDVTAIVHGSGAADAADEAADVLFGGDPTKASADGIEAVTAEVPSSQVLAERLADVVQLLVDTEMATSKGDARRTLEGGGFRCNGVPIEADARLDEQALLHDRFLLLQRGKKSHHVVEVFH
jgi:tyrosyl-tRNA synthetase